MARSGCRQLTLCAAARANSQAGAGSSPEPERSQDDVAVYWDVAPARYDAGHHQVEEGIEELNDPLLWKLIDELS